MSKSRKCSKSMHLTPSSTMGLSSQEPSCPLVPDWSLSGMGDENVSQKACDCSKHILGILNRVCSAWWKHGSAQYPAARIRPHTSRCSMSKWYVSCRFRTNLNGRSSVVVMPQTSSGTVSRELMFGTTGMFSDVLNGMYGCLGFRSREEQKVLWTNLTNTCQRVPHQHHTSRNRHLHNIHAHVRASTEGTDESLARCDLQVCLWQTRTRADWLLLPCFYHWLHFLNGKTSMGQINQTTQTSSSDTDSSSG